MLTNTWHLSYLTHCALLASTVVQVPCYIPLCFAKEISVGKYWMKIYLTHYVFLSLYNIQPNSYRFYILICLERILLLWPYIFLKVSSDMYPTKHYWDRVACMGGEQGDEMNLEVGKCWVETRVLWVMSMNEEVGVWWLTTCLGWDECEDQIICIYWNTKV